MLYVPYAFLVPAFLLLLNTCSGLLRPRSVWWSVVPLGWTPNCPTKCKSCMHHKTMHNNKNVHVGRTPRLANNTRHLETCIVLSKSVKHTNMVCLVNHKISDTNQSHLLAPSAVQTSGHTHLLQPMDQTATKISFRKDGRKFIAQIEV
jgi:hypothetical protein